jgi:hypothetical protein
MEEIWKQIENYENYSVSSLGQVRNDDTKKILKGCKNRDGRFHVDCCKNGIIKRFQIHRLVALAFIENPEGKLEIDHIDNNPSNNRVENLRWSTREENSRNTRIRSNNTSGVKGVCWDKSREKWSAEIKIDGIKVHIGRFNTIEEATLARQTRANQAFGVFTNACETNQS